MDCRRPHLQRYVLCGSRRTRLAVTTVIFGGSAAGVRISSAWRGRSEQLAGRSRRAGPHWWLSSNHYSGPCGSVGIEAGHLAPPSREPGDATDGCVPSSTHLARSGSLLAAAWFTFCGCEVSWPLEPSRYDLLVEHQGTITRVQVETATVGLGELDCMAIDDRQKTDALQC